MDIRDRTVDVSIGSLVSMLALGSMLWFIIQPLMILQISSALAEDFEEQIATAQEPIQTAFKVLLLSDINRLKRSIARLEYREEHESDGWTVNDATRLADYRIELEAFIEASDDL